MEERRVGDAAAGRPRSWQARCDPIRSTIPEVSTGGSVQCGFCGYDLQSACPPVCSECGRDPFDVSRVRNNGVAFRRCLAALWSAFLCIQFVEWATLEDSNSNSTMKWVGLLSLIVRALFMVAFVIFTAGLLFLRGGGLGSRPSDNRKILYGATGLSIVAALVIYAWWFSVSR